MNQLHATRFQTPQRRKGNFFNQKFPHGSIQRKIFFYAVIPLVIIIALILIMDKIVMPIVTRHNSEFNLPDFTDMKMFEAQVNLSELNLKYEITAEKYSPGKEQGTILNQFPIAGTKVKAGRVIKFVISLGKKMVMIPDLAGLSVRQSILDLETAGLKLGEISWAFSDTLPPKVVVFSYPPKDTEVPMGSPVNLMVNRGRATNFTYMPNVVGLPLSEAQTKIEEKYLKVGIVTTRIDENFLPETVLEQSEPEGTELDVGTEIDLVVSTVP